MESGTTLSDHIKARRKQLGISQSAAARKAGVHRQTWLAWEAGKSAPEEYNYFKIDHAMDWVKGRGVDSIMSGKDPVLIETRPVPRYPPEIYERVIRDDTERRIMALLGASEEYRWRVIRILRENAYDAQRSRDDDAQRRLA